MTSKQFADLLVRHGLVDADAIENPEGYDNSATLDRIRAAHFEIDIDREKAALAGFNYGKKTE